MLIESTQTSTFHDNHTLVHHVNCDFCKKKSASRIKSMINLEILFLKYVI